MNTYTITLVDEETSEYLELQIHVSKKVHLCPELIGQVIAPIVPNNDGKAKVFLSGTMFKGLVIKELSREALKVKLS